jgi:hypothetical protein
MNAAHFIRVGGENRMQSFESLSDTARRTVEMATDALSEDEQAAEFLFSQSKRDRLFRTEVFGSAEPEIGALLRLVRECRRSMRI